MRSSEAIEVGLVVTGGRNSGESETSYPHLPLVTADSYPAAGWNAPRLLYRFPSHPLVNSAHTSVAPPLGTVLALKARWERGYGRCEQGRQSSCLRGAYSLAER